MSVITEINVDIHKNITYISAVERERRNISIENIQHIAEALNIEPYLLLMDPQNLSE